MELVTKKDFDGECYYCTPVDSFDIWPYERWDHEKQIIPLTITTEMDGAGLTQYLADRFKLNIFSIFYLSKEGGSNRLRPWDQLKDVLPNSHRELTIRVVGDVSARVC